VKEPAAPRFRRIHVIGAIGSGKSTTAHRIADRLGLTFVELDAIQYQNGWTVRSSDEFKADVFAALDNASHGWVVAGNYFSILDLSVISQADTIVWLRIPFHSAFPRLICRTVQRAWNREELWNGNHESWRVSFFSRESVLLEATTKARGRQKVERAVLERLSPKPVIIELTTYEQIDRFVGALS
jgi:adenylate kinase family enzyme